MCHQFPVDVFADIDFRGIKMEAVKFLLQPLVVAFDDFQDVVVDLPVGNQGVTQAFVAVLDDGELPVLFHDGAFDGGDFVDAGGTELYLLYIFHF